MPLAKLHDHLHNVTERLDIVTVALLSDGPAARQDLMAERRFLLADVARICAQLEHPSAAPLLGSTPSLAQSLRLIKG